MRIVVTTGRERSLSHELAAKDLCERYGLAFSPRGNRRLEAVIAETGAEIVGVYGGEGLVLARDGVKLRFSAGMAELRIKRVLAGEHEPLVALGQVKYGDAVLDATLGLARDALVLAAAGAHVEGLEGQPTIAAFREAGLAVVEGAAGEVASRIRVRQARYPELLASAKPKSFDVVYLDPMFTDEVTMPAEYELFRLLADASPLTKESLNDARRVARRAVIVKDGPRGNLVKLIGAPIDVLTFGTRVRYARFEPL